MSSVSPRRQRANRANRGRSTSRRPCPTGLARQMRVANGPLPGRCWPACAATSAGSTTAAVRDWRALNGRSCGTGSGASSPVPRFRSGARSSGGLLLPHPNGVVIHPEAEIGPNCLFFQQVTLGTWRAAACRCSAAMSTSAPVRRCSAA